MRSHAGDGGGGAGSGDREHLTAGDSHASSCDDAP
jgi:hypothetical protein